MTCLLHARLEELRVERAWLGLGLGLGLVVWYVTVRVRVRGMVRGR